MFIYIFKLDFEMFRVTIIGITGYLNLRLLYKVSYPLSNLRKILLIICCISFCLLLIFFSDFFLIKDYNFISFTFVFVLILANNYIVDFFEEIYDKIVLRIERRRRKMVSEK